MDFFNLFKDLQVNDHAKTAQSQAVEYLCSKGYDCKTEVWVSSRGDGTDKKGRIDIVASKDDVTIGIEFDKAMPRKRSLFKLSNFDCDYRLVLLRGGKKHYIADGVEVLSVKLKEVRSQ